jgi:hypothetical protein
VNVCEEAGAKGKVVLADMLEVKANCVNVDNGEEGSLDGDISQGRVPVDDTNKGVAGVRGGGEEVSV